MPPAVPRLLVHVLGAVVLGATVLAHADPASAIVGPATVVDGPAPDVGQLGGADMAADGTGGIVYQRTVDGQPHVFVSRFDARRWSAPERVDAGQRFRSSWPRIAAASGGRLVVVWTQDGGPGLDGLWSAVLQRGSRRFLPPTLVDFTVGEDQATAPTIAMNDAGGALLVYRAITRFTGPDLTPGTVAGEIRMARFNGSRWQRLGVPANRNRAAGLPAPTGDNAPAIAIDGQGGGVVAWQEPDDDLVPRVWARRIFGSRVGSALAASPIRQGPQLVRGGADRPAVAASALGRAVVTFRQLPDPRDRAALAMAYVNQLPEPTIGTSGATFQGPLAVGPAGDATPSIGLGGSTDALVAMPRAGTAILGYAPTLPGAIAQLEQGPADAAPAPVVVAGADGRAVLAAASSAGGGEVAVRELHGTTVQELAPLSAGPGGPIRELAAGGSGSGDAIVAWTQGTDDDRRIAAAIVDAPPSPFRLTLPVTWDRAARPVLTWDAAADTLGPVRYTLWIDGRAILRTSSTTARLREGTLRQGTHTVRVTASDLAGQRTTADPARYRLDRQPPRITVALGGRRATVTVSDPGGALASGPATETTVRWGDGGSSEGAARRATHAYRRAGRFVISVAAADRAGNRTVRTMRVRVGPTP